MGIFGRKAAAPTLSGSVQIGSLGLDGDYETDVVGESNYREALTEWLDDHVDDDGWEEGRVSADIVLEPEPSNPYDVNAVRVVLSDSGDVVGYLPREVAAVWSPRLQEMQRAGASELWCGGVVLWRPLDGDPRWDSDIPVGVRLDLSDSR